MPGLEHRRHHLATAQQEAERIDAPGGLEGVGRSVEERSEHAAPRIVEQGLDHTQVRPDAREGVPHGRLVGDVGGVGSRARNAPRQLVEALGRAGEHGDAISLGGKAAHQCGARAWPDPRDGTHPFAHGADATLESDLKVEGRRGPHRDRVLGPGDR